MPTESPKRGAVIFRGPLIYTGALASWPSPLKGSGFKFCLVALRLCSQTHAGCQGVTQTHGESHATGHGMDSPTAPAPPRTRSVQLSHVLTSEPEEQPQTPTSTMSSPSPRAQCPSTPSPWGRLQGGASGQMSEGFLLHPRQSPPRPAELRAGHRAHRVCRRPEPLAKKPCPSQGLPIRDVQKADCGSLGPIFRF